MDENKFTFIKTISRYVILITCMVTLFIVVYIQSYLHYDLKFIFFSKDEGYPESAGIPPKNFTCRISTTAEALSDSEGKIGDPELFNSWKIFDKIAACNPKPIQLLSFSEDRNSPHVSQSGKILKVPNIVHRIKYSSKSEFKFATYISYKSVEKFLKPDIIFLHGDTLPHSKWWNKTIAEIPNIYFVYHPLPKTIGGKKWRSIQHCADVTRLQIISDYGGIYLDDDLIVVKSFDPLRTYNLTLGRETDYAVQIAAIIGVPANDFIKKWLDSYKHFHPYSWNQNSLLMADKLAKTFPNLVHIENKSMFYPNYNMFDEMYKSNEYDWSENYCVHFYKEKRAKLPKDEETVKGYDCTAGQVLRYVLYGNKNVLSNKTYHA